MLADRMMEKIRDNRLYPRDYAVIGDKAFVSCRFECALVNLRMCGVSGRCMIDLMFESPCRILISRSRSRYPGRFYSCLKDDELARLPREQQVEAKFRNKLLTQVRVASEWGCGSLKRSFPRLTVPLPASRSTYRRVLIELCCYLFNFRARLVGVNQIRTVYAPWLAYDAPQSDRVLGFYGLG